MPASDNVGVIDLPLIQGLIRNKPLLQQSPNSLRVAVNYEPALKGGFRRLSGSEKFVNFPLTTGSTIAAFPRMVALLNPTQVIAAIGGGVQEAHSTKLTSSIDASVTTIPVVDNSTFPVSGTVKIGDEEITYTGKTGSTALSGGTRGANGTVAAAHTIDSIVSTDWTVIDSRNVTFGVSKKMDWVEFNFNGTQKILYADGVNDASTYDGTTVVDITGSGAPNDPTYVAVFANHAFYAGQQGGTNQEIIFSAPFDETDFASGNGAGSFLVPNPIVGMKLFREELYIFCTESIHKLTGTSASNFQLVDVSERIGCVSNWTIQELAGDIVFLATDGIRTIRGTERIGDVELGTISKPVQDLFEDIAPYDYFESVIVPQKTQYRLFFSRAGESDVSTEGIIMSLTEDGYKFTTMKGVRPTATDAFYGNDLVDDIVLYGAFDNYIYQMERPSNKWGNGELRGVLRTTDIVVSDAGLRKPLDVVHIDFEAEGALNTSLHVRYDYEKANVVQPAKYSLTTTGLVSRYGTAIYGEDTYGGNVEIVTRQPIEGGGFAVALAIRDDGECDPYTIKGFQIEARQGARR